MDAEKIMDENGNGDQRLDIIVPDDMVIVLADSVQSFLRFKWSQRREQDFGMTARVASADAAWFFLR